MGEGYACDRPIGWTYEERLLIACEKPESGRLTCTAPIPLEVTEREQRFTEDGDLQDEHTLRRFSLRASYTHGRITLQTGRGQPPPPWRRRFGVHSIAQLSDALDWR